MSIISWPRQEAERILKSLKPDQDRVLLETGYGPSGLPHIGTFAEVARTLFVLQALKHLKPKIKAQLLVFSDDMDGLRSLPENVPGHDMLRGYLGAPLSSIPDPFDQKESFAAYMNSRLKLFLDSFGFEYELKSSTQCYRQGEFDEGLKQVMNHYDEIREIFVRTISEEKRAAWSPFFPICQSCGKIYTTRVTAIDRLNYKISYSCDQGGKLFQPCGHENETDITGGRVKVGWKVDWALRWYVLGVNYEMHGKDLMESANISSRICRKLGGSPPVNYKYELFLDENGAKISKKIGNGISMDQWLKYAPMDVLLNFILANPNKAKRMGLPILTRLIDEYLQLSRTQSSGEELSPLWFIQKVQNKKLSSFPQTKGEIGYSLLYNVAESLSIHEADLLFDYAAKYDAKVKDNEEFFRMLCQKVITFFEDNIQSASPETLQIERKFSPGLLVLQDKLLGQKEKPMDGDEMQSFLFTIAKENEFKQRNWFLFLYQTLLGKNQGPKMGPFFAMLGQDKTLALVKKALAKYPPES